MRTDVHASSDSRSLAKTREGLNGRNGGGPGITRSDLMVINKIDLAPLVGANLAVMEADTVRMRQTRPFVFSNLKSGEGVEHIAEFIVVKGGLEPHESGTH